MCICNSYVPIGLAPMYPELLMEETAEETDTELLNQNLTWLNNPIISSMSRFGDILKHPLSLGATYFKEMLTPLSHQLTKHEHILSNVLGLMHFINNCCCSSLYWKSHRNEHEERAHFIETRYLGLKRVSRYITSPAWIYYIDLWLLSLSHYMRHQFHNFICTSRAWIICDLFAKLISLQRIILF